MRLFVLRIKSRGRYAHVLQLVKSASVFGNCGSMLIQNTTGTCNCVRSKRPSSFSNPVEFLPYRNLARSLNYFSFSSTQVRKCTSVLENVTTFERGLASAKAYGRTRN